MEQLFEELDGMTDLGMVEESLACCKLILREAEHLNGNQFTQLSSTIGMFSENCAAWFKPMEKRFVALTGAEKQEVTSRWVLFLASVEAPWEDFKRFANLRQLDGDSIYIICAAAIGVGDEDWCKQALPVVAAIASNVTTECTPLLAHAALLGFLGKEVDALGVIQNLRVEKEWYATYLNLLSRFCFSHYLKSLDYLSEEIQSLVIDSETELKLPGLAKAHFDEIMESIAKARAAIEPLFEGLMPSL